MQDIPRRRSQFVWLLAFVTGGFGVLGILYNVTPAIALAGLLAICCVKIANYTKPK